MRRFLLWLATMGVGTATLMAGLSIFAGGSAAGFLAGVLFFVFALAVGLVLSAPAFLNPPDGGGVWFFRLPLGLWMFLMVFKLISWIGFQILLGAWMLIFHFWHNRAGAQHPTFNGAGAPAPAAAHAAGFGTQPGGFGPGAQPGGFGAQPGGFGPGANPGGFGPGGGSGPTRQALPAASWLQDPTGRYVYRYWDGARWTQHVATGSAQAVDPLGTP